MLVVMQQGATEAQIQRIIDRLIEDGFDVHRSTGVVEAMDAVKEVHRIVSPYKLASRGFRPQGTVVKIRDVEIGGSNVVVMAGPCSVENREQIEQAADIVADGGGRVIRGGAFKPRSSP